MPRKRNPWRTLAIVVTISAISTFTYQIQTLDALADDLAEAEAQLSGIPHGCRL